MDLAKKSCVATLDELCVKLGLIVTYNDLFHDIHYEVKCGNLTVTGDECTSMIKAKNSAARHMLALIHDNSTVHDNDPPPNPVDELDELAEKYALCPTIYKFHQVGDSDQFTCHVRFGDTMDGVGVGTSQEAAKQCGAKQILTEWREASYAEKDWLQEEMYVWSQEVMKENDKKGSCQRPTTGD